MSTRTKVGTTLQSLGNRKKAAVKDSHFVSKWKIDLRWDWIGRWDLTTKAMLGILDFISV